MSLQFKSPVQMKPRVKFSDELVFLDSIKDKDFEQLRSMLRRASLKVDMNKVNSSGLTALHQAVFDDSIELVGLLIENKACINVVDDDSWTPLHAACSMGFYEIAKYLLEKGADACVVSKEGERPLDVVDTNNLPLISLLLNYMTEAKKELKSPSHEISVISPKKKKEKDTIFFFPVPSNSIPDYYEKNLNKILQSSKSDNDSIIKEIKHLSDDSFMKSKEFISFLTTAVCESCINNEGKLNTAILNKKLPIISKFLANKQELDLEVLYAAQNLDAKYGYLPGFLRNLFDTFYYCDLVKKDTFKLWKKTPNPCQTEDSHQKALSLLKDFFTF